MADLSELVNAFNTELQSIYDVKPPISKGKMTAITKAALKSPMLYKHVVQSVEKLIQKCKSEYKIPGLYVIDSIIRQSRHQYGIDKDLFAGRFARNIRNTFVHIYKCPEEDKPKVIRVLNLWQKNKIFQPEVIAPLFDLADPNNPIWDSVIQGVTESGVNSGTGATANNGTTNSSTHNSFFGEVQFKSHLLDYDYDEDPPDDGGERGQSTQSNTSSAMPKPPPPPLLRQEQTAGIAGVDALGSLLSNPEVLRQLQTLQEQMTAAAQQQAQVGFLTPEQERQRKLAELNKQEAAFDQRLAQTVAKTPFAVDCGDFIEAQEKAKSPDTGMSFPHGSIDQNSNQLAHAPLAPPAFFQHIQPDQARNPFGLPINFPLLSAQFPNQHHQQSEQQNQMAMYGQLQGEGGIFRQNFHAQQQGHSAFDPSIQEINDDELNHRDRNSRERHRNDRRRRRSRSRDKRRSGSIELSPRSRRRSRSRSRSRSRVNRSRERREEKERQRKGFGVVKRDHLSVCSTTLWVGHLSKLVSQEELSDTFGQYGDIVSIDMIQSRGCAFVVMNRRQDAVKALDRLRNKKLQGKEITLAWAPGKGVKGREWKDYWEVEHGISYIPWTKLTIETDLEEFEEGGCVDESTLPEFLKISLLRLDRPKKEKVDPAAKEKKEGESAEGDENQAAAPAEGTNGIKANPAPEIPIPTPVPPVMPNPAPFGMPPGVGMMGVPHMGMNMMMPPPLMGGPMGMPPFMMGMMNLNPADPASQMKNPMTPGPGLLGDMPLLPQQLNNSSVSMPNSVQEEDGGMGGDRNGERMNQPERKERKRSRFDNADERISPNPPVDHDGRSDSPKKELRTNEGIFDRLKSIAEGYSGNNGGGGPDPGKMASRLLGSPIGPPPLLGSPRGPNNFRGGFRPPFMERMPGGGGNRPWFDNSSSSSQNPFVNPSQNPFGPPFLGNENPFDVDGPGGRRPPRGDREFFGPNNEPPHFGPKRGGWERGPGPWRGRGSPMMRGRGRGGPWMRGGGPKPHHSNFIVNNP